MSCLSGLVQLAVQNQQQLIAARATYAPTELNLMLEGVPRVDSAQVVVQRSNDESIKVVIWGIDNKPLPRPAWVMFVVDALAWTQVASTTRYVYEPVGVDATGADILVLVDGQRNCWELTCACGRKRYTTVNNRGRVRQCRVCTQRQRRKYQTTWQRKHRKKA